MSRVPCLLIVIPVVIAFRRFRLHQGIPSQTRGLQQRYMGTKCHRISDGKCRLYYSLAAP